LRRVAGFGSDDIETGGVGCLRGRRAKEGNAKTGGYGCGRCAEEVSSGGRGLIAGRNELKSRHCRPPQDGKDFASDKFQPGMGEARIHGFSAGYIVNTLLRFELFQAQRRRR
jgi:hypothetical protein